MATPDVTTETDALKIAVVARDAARTQFKEANATFQVAQDALSVANDALLVAQDVLNVALGADTKPKEDPKDPKGGAVDAGAVAADIKP